MNSNTTAQFSVELTPEQVEAREKAKLLRERERALDERIAQEVFGWDLIEEIPENFNWDPRGYFRDEEGDLESSPPEYCKFLRDVFRGRIRHPYLR